MLSWSGRMRGVLRMRISHRCSKLRPLALYTLLLVMFSISWLFGTPAIGILCLLLLVLSYFYLTQTTILGGLRRYLERQISRLTSSGQNRATPLAAQVPEAVQPPRRLVEHDGDAGGVRDEAVDGDVGNIVEVVAPAVPEHDRVEL